MIRNILLPVLLAVSSLSFAKDCPTIKSGVDFVPVVSKYTPASVLLTNKEYKNNIVVWEFFWYNCGHCFDFQAPFADWKKKQPPNVVIKKIPAAPNEYWAVGAKLFYALEDVKAPQEIHAKIFDEIHVKGNKIVNDKDKLIAFLNKNKINGNNVVKAMDSFNVYTKVQEARKMMQAYGVPSTPSLVIQNSYVINSKLPNYKGHNDLLNATQKVINSLSCTAVKK